ncbi:S9 family peptidase [Lentzea sp. HUAS12]|uniref:alpha/beta hydrolase family protein n=1 Tax=Lentzea sp. HUAS12 TaxID=2951806 RepID=UPI0020A032D1|nr:CocE/NonD family hydrolase [Lentzea sp. HUAS12]USX56299.1 prolyl oligopeptidase family serine peptidase [Lentzea sp. HUAS12]
MTVPGSAFSPADPERAGVLTAFPLTRLVDSGLDLGRAQRLLAAFAGGQDWGLAAEHEAGALQDLLADAGSVSRTALLRRLVATRAVAAQAFGLPPERRRELHERMRRSLADLVAEVPGLQLVEVPHAGGRLHGLLATPGTVRPAPCVIIVGGLDKWGPAFLGTAAALIERGLAVLVIDLPGQGTTLFDGGLVADAGIADAVVASVDWLVGSPAVGDRIGVWGNSFGGLFAALGAASDERLFACCVNGAPASPVVPAVPALRGLLEALFGLSDEAALAGVLRAVSLGDARIGCPLLVLHGGADTLVAEADRDAFVAAGAAGSRVLEWPDGEHTLYNRAVERDALVGDWFAAVLS